MIKNFLITIFAILSLTITTKAFAQDDINCLARAIYFESKGGLERDMKEAMARIEELNRVTKPVVMIRMEPFNG